MMYLVVTLTLVGQWLEDEVFDSYEEAIKYAASLEEVREVLIRQIVL